MKVAHIFIIAIAFLSSTFIGMCLIKSLPQSEMKNIQTISEATTIHTDRMIPARSELTSNNFDEKIVKVLGDDMLVLIIRPTDELGIDCDDIHQNVIVQKVINGNPSLESNEIELYYAGFHVQSYEELTLSKRQGDPYLYYTNCCGILKPQKEYIVFCKSFTIGNSKIYRAAYSSFPSFFPVKADNNSIMILNKGDNDYSELWDYDIYVSNNDQMDNWNNLQEYVYNKYYGCQ